jgi:excisionase family DNA binding protein
MSKTQTKPRKTKTAAPVNGVPTPPGVAMPATDVLTFSEAAAYLRVTEAELRCLINDQALPGRQFGTEWRFLKSAIQDWLKTPPVRGSREAVLSTLGSWKDDPYQEELLKGIYKRRGRPMTEDEG